MKILHDPAKRVAALLKIAKCVKAGASGRKQHHVTVAGYPARQLHRPPKIGIGVDRQLSVLHLFSLVQRGADLPSGRARQITAMARSHSTTASGANERCLSAPPQITIGFLSPNADSAAAVREGLESIELL